MTERQRLKLHEERIWMYNRDKGICQWCGQPLEFGNFEVAHRIANTVSNRKRYGADVVNSVHNKACTHRGRCNDGVNCGYKPDKCAEIVEMVKQDKLQGKLF
jgi:hypothetical protein